MGLSTFDILKHASMVEGSIELDAEKLEALQCVLAGILRDVNEVCLKNSIPYVLGGGNVSRRCSPQRVHTLGR